jgi:hypothetical protein
LDAQCSSNSTAAVGYSCKCSQGYWADDSGTCISEHH